MIPAYPEYFWLTAVAAVVLVGIAKAGFGGGVGVIATPLMALTIPVADAAALLLPLLIIIDLIAIRHYWRAFDREAIRLLLPAAGLGVLVGGLLFSVLSDKEQLLKIGIGLLALIFVAYQAGRRVLLNALTRHRPPPAVGVALGALAGFTSTLAHAGGPPVTIYLLPQELPREVFVGTTVIFFTILNLVKLIPYSLLGLLNVGNLTTIFLLAPFCFLGVWLGLFLNRRFTDDWFRRVVYTLLFLTGVQLVAGRNLLGFIS